MYMLYIGIVYEEEEKNRDGKRGSIGRYGTRLIALLIFMLTNVTQC